MVDHRFQSGPEATDESHDPRLEATVDGARGSSDVESRDHRTAGPESMLVFRAGSLWLGIPSHFVDSLHARPQATPVPLAPPHVEGLSILRGEVVPLFDIGKFLKIEDQSERASLPVAGSRSASFGRVAVVSAAGMQVGILCSEVRGIISVTETPSQDGMVTRGRMIEKVAAGEVTTRDGVLVVLDLPKLLEEAQVRL